MVNIKDIAKKAGMSPSTVSRVVNGKKYVNPEKRSRILKLIEETGYVPNKAARSMVLKRSFTVGIVIPDLFNMFQRQLISVIERHLETFGYHILIFFAALDGSGDGECLNKIKAESLDGIILLQEMKLPQVAEYLAAEKIPAVACTVSSGVIPCIHVDDERAARDAVAHLIGLGHKKIALIYAGGFSWAVKRTQGYFQALEEAGLRADRGRIAPSELFSAESGLRAAEALLSRTRDFTAVFAITDELAMGAIRGLRDAGIRVPGDVSVVGFDDIEASEYLCPRLTTIKQPIPEMGAEAAFFIHHRITRPGTDLPGKGVVPHRLVVRESTARPEPKKKQKNSP
ncbi:MAG: LacI family transcriptional regulator [Spirochaetaceae bacterium]|jgi:LacI family transcriptional regulator|nr:LacI family transcriptional regulator [Spirochaetaceae bacterium]